LDKLGRTGIIPEDQYFTFNKYDNMDVASDQLQVPHDAAFRVEVDTLDYLDDTVIPNGDWGQANYLEPITVDHPEFGAGGASQVKITKPVQVIEMVDLRNGQILYPGE
jgi:hypothetical protein